MRIEKGNHLLLLKEDGVYLYETELNEPLSKLSIENKKSKREKSENKWKLVEKITLTGSVYELLFSVVDAIVNRSLQRDFSFEADNYAAHLRIIFALLVNKLNLDKGFAYDKKFLASKKPEEFDADEFIAIKRVLDSNKNLETKKAFFDLSGNYAQYDKELAEKLDGYASDDSDRVAEESDDELEVSSFSEYEYSLDAFSSFASKEQIRADQKKINDFLEKRDPVKDKLKIKNGEVEINGQKLKTKFVIAGFRGINHMPLRFSDEVRRVSRLSAMQKRRAEMPYFAEAVLESQLDFYRNAEDVKRTFLAGDSEVLQELIANAQQLEPALLDTKNEDYILTHGLTNAGADDVRLFDNFLYFLQHVYSNGIIKSQRFLREHLLSKELLVMLPNAYNPFVSESEAPDHALRYSLGLKSLYQPAALHSHYKSDGGRAFPYLGEIYISIRDMEVFTGQRERHQLRRLETKYRVNPSIPIAPEIESTGFAWLPSGEVVFSETIKCPSFKGHWTSDHKTKYGISKQYYDSFKKRLFRGRNKTHREVAEQDIIQEHLIGYYKNRLLERAVNYAKDHQQVLIFLDSKGKLSFELPGRDMKSDADENAKATRQELERALYQKVKASTPVASVKLTSKTLKVYRVSEKLVQDTSDALKKGSSQSSARYDRFIQEGDQFRTPPSEIRKARSSLSPKRGPGLYSYRGSPGTPLSSRLKAAVPNDWYDDTQVNRLLNHYFETAEDLKVLEALPLENENEITGQLIEGRLIEAFEEHINLYYLPLRVNDNHWIGLYVDRTEGNSLIYWIDPYGGLSVDRQAQILDILNSTNIFDGELTEDHIHFQEVLLQRDGVNCGPWIIEILRYIRENGGFPEEDEIDINVQREEHNTILASTAPIEELGDLNLSDDEAGSKPRLV